MSDWKQRDPLVDMMLKDKKIIKKTDKKPKLVEYPEPLGWLDKLLANPFG